MKGLGCSDMGMECSFIAVGKNPERIKKILFDHAVRRHKSMLPGRAEIIERIDRMLLCQFPASSHAIHRLDTGKHVCEDACIAGCRAFIPIRKRPGNEFPLE